MFVAELKEPHPMITLFWNLLLVINQRAFVVVRRRSHIMSIKARTIGFPTNMESTNILSTHF